MIRKSDWRLWERETQERRLPPPLPKTSWDWQSEPGLWAQLCEWCARHCLLALLLVSVAIAGVYLFLDSIRK